MHAIKMSGFFLNVELSDAGYLLSPVSSLISLSFFPMLCQQLPPICTPNLNFDRGR